MRESASKRPRQREKMTAIGSRRAPKGSSILSVRHAAAALAEALPTLTQLVTSPSKGSLYDVRHPGDEGEPRRGDSRSAAGEPEDSRPRLLQKRVEGARGAPRRCRRGAGDHAVDVALPSPDPPPVSPDHDFIDYVTQLTGETATIFAWDPRSGGTFVRRTTNIRRDDGTRAVGTVLGETSAAYAPMMAGEPFLGTGLDPRRPLRGPPTSRSSPPGRHFRRTRRVSRAFSTSASRTPSSPAACPTRLSAFGWRALSSSSSGPPPWRSSATRSSHRCAAPSPQFGALADGRKVDVSGHPSVGTSSAPCSPPSCASPPRRKRAFENVQVLEQSSQAILTAAAEDDMRIGFANRAARDLFGGPCRERPSPARDPFAGAPLADLDPRGRGPVGRRRRSGPPAPHAHRPLRQGGGGLRPSPPSRAGTAASRALPCQPPRPRARSLTATPVRERRREPPVAGGGSLDVPQDADRCCWRRRATAGTRDMCRGGLTLRPALPEAIQTVAAAVEELNGSFAEVAERNRHQRGPWAREAAAATAGASASARASRGGRQAHQRGGEALIARRRRADETFSPSTPPSRRAVPARRGRDSPSSPPR